MIEAISSTSEFITANMYAAPGLGHLATQHAREFASNIGNAAILDDEVGGVIGARRVVEPLALTATLGAEMTVGNEVAVAGFGLSAAEVLKSLQPTGKPVIDIVLQATSAGAASYGFSYWQQRGFGRVTQEGLKRFPQTIDMVSNIANERLEGAQEELNSDRQLAKTAGSEALIVGTSLSYILHKIKRPLSTPEQDKQVIKQGAKVIATFWGGVIGAATFLSGGAERVENNWLIQSVSQSTKPSSIIPLIGGLYLAKEWCGLLAARIKQK